MQLFALPFPHIDPVLISFGPLTIRWYALAYITGILGGWWYARQLVSRDNLWKPGASPVQIIELDDFMLWATLGIVLGGRLGYVLFYNPLYYMDNPLAALALWQGGMSFHGGLTGVIIAIILFTRKQGLPLWSFLDIIAAVAPIGLFFGRIANFINGELWGRVTDVPWAVIFPTAGPDPRHPSQLYEAILEGLILFMILTFLIYKRQALSRPGLVCGTFALVYGLSRIIVEFVRQPDPQLGLFFGILSMGMLLSLPLIVLGIWGIHRSFYALPSTPPHIKE